MHDIYINVPYTGTVIGESSKYDIGQYIVECIREYVGLYQGLGAEEFEQMSANYRHDLRKN